jgi:hypothetical protein
LDRGTNDYDATAIDVLLIIIYLGFIALGLPDSLFGSSWPVIHVLMDVPISYAGIVTITISGDTDAQYGRVIGLMALLKEAGFDKVGLKTEPKPLGKK